MQAYSKGEPFRSPFVYSFLALLIFLHALILLHGFRGDSGRGFGAVSYLRIGCARADGSPCFAAAETNSNADHHY